jgi:hypothetical protein
MITLKLKPSEAHLRLSILDDAYKGQGPFPVAAYGDEGRAAVIGMFLTLSEAIRASGQHKGGAR